MELLDIPGIGEKTVSALERAGIHTLTELLETYPRTYRQYRAVTATGGRVGDWIVLKGHLSRPVSRHTGRVTTQLSTFQDHTGRLTLRWFNLPYLSRSISPSTLYLVKGRLETFRGVKQLVSPQLTKITAEVPLADQLVPIYRQIGSLKPWVLRSKIAAALAFVSTLPDPLPPKIVSKYSLLPYLSALHGIHQPTSKTALEPAVYRLSFQELYFLQLQALQKRKGRSAKITPLTFEPNLRKKFAAALPYTPTTSQLRAIKEVAIDLAKPHPMHRLLAGEVGSGKTTVAAAAAYFTQSTGFRTLVMAPTVILAHQLYDSLSSLLQPHRLTLSLITATNKGNLKADVIIGTQALLHRHPTRVGLVVIDEQHRFGVNQRQALTTLAGNTHTLLMTATPIPRSLALTLFGHLEVTLLSELPAGRLPVKTFLVPNSKRSASYSWIKQQVKQGCQVFMVTPLIEEAAEQDLSPLKSIRSLERELTALFPNLNIDVMHGKMKDHEKTAHMDKFRRGETQILVATSMIEVGIDVPAANIMLIEDADRFGLAQLHQLRGRVGRGGKQAYCLLFTQNNTRSVQERLAYFIRERRGDKLALYDLQTRGPGELFGTEQHGFFRLKLANIYDEQLIKKTFQAIQITTSN